MRALMVQGMSSGAGKSLGRLAVTTTYESAKRTVRTTTRFDVLPVSWSWSWLEGRSASGCEIRHGRTEPAAVASCSWNPAGAERL